MGVGGARPKATVKDGADYWLVKPGLYTDTTDLALLEHATQLWGRLARMNFAGTHHHSIAGGRSMLRVKRFDRVCDHRIMAVSGASLLQIQTPSYRRTIVLAPATRGWRRNCSVSAPPQEDRLELFRRMIFNAVVGNDDDHPRNHAMVYSHAERRWRLSPAFYVVPNPEEDAGRLAMQFCAGRREIGRETILSDHAYFGIKTREQAEAEIGAMCPHLGRFRGDREAAGSWLARADAAAPDSGDHPGWQSSRLSSCHGTLRTWNIANSGLSRILIVHNVRLCNSLHRKCIPFRRSACRRFSVGQGHRFSDAF